MQRRAIRVNGVVQGVGFRPFVFALAHDTNVSGFVGNDSDGVFIEIEGADSACDEFLARLKAEAPPMSRVDSCRATEIPPLGDTDFLIVESSESVGTTSIPPDTAVCQDCLEEMRDPGNRRFGYPFIACTNCGPRYTIVTGLPYDRPFTTMADFPMCSECQAEYDDPHSRRFHAQPTACSACGPSLSMPVAEIVSRLRTGQILAIKGIGGYHLVCDARNASVVGELRNRKQRGSKPFAIMAATVKSALDAVELDSRAQESLASPARPIVLAPSRDAELQASAAPGNRTLGMMLPYAPLHHLLFDAGAPELLVMTSGNLADEPICITESEAQERLGAIADAFVHHDRRIHVACDDSVVRVMATGLQPVRRSRGFAPLPITLPITTSPVVAVGGEIKTTACIATGTNAWMSQHIGDTGNLETLAMLDRTVRMLAALQRVEPQAIISDAHPGYLSRRWAEDEAARRGIAHITVQHHHAHVASLMAEHGIVEPILGFAFDGTGFGTDGTIWGGELLLADLSHAERIGHLASFPLPGGDAATRQVSRIAIAQLRAAGMDRADDLAAVRATEGLAVIERMLDTGVGCSPTTSMGRLFDAVSSILDVRHVVDYEGQAAIELEALAATAPAGSAQEWEPSVSDDLVLDPALTIRAAVAAVRSGRDRASAARAFHEGLAVGVARMAILARERHGISTVGLTGGVFSNSLLTDACQERLSREGFTVLIHHLVPPSDGGLALGQVAVAAARS